MNFPQAAQARSSANGVIAVFVVLWFALVLFLGAKGAFVRPPGAAPLPILAGAILPLVTFALAFFGWSGFHEKVLTAELRLLTSIQAWRAGGLGFLALAAHGVLPGLFAWPAGLGDIAIGLSAPWVALALTRRPAFAASRGFIVWNILGIMDLVVAVSLGALGSGLVPGLVGAVTTAPMAQLPLVLIPAFFVPIFIMLHLTALFQAHAEREPQSGKKTIS